jgi:hypothetical protein
MQLYPQVHTCPLHVHYTSITCPLHVLQSIPANQHFHFCVFVKQTAHSMHLRSTYIIHQSCSNTAFNNISIQHESTYSTYKYIKNTSIMQQYGVLQDAYNVYIQKQRVQLVQAHSVACSLLARPHVHTRSCTSTYTMYYILYSIPFNEEQFHNRTWSVIMGSSDKRSTSGSSVRKSDRVGYIQKQSDQPAQTPMKDINLTLPTLIFLSHLNRSTTVRRWHCQAPHLSEARKQKIKVRQNSEAVTISCRELSCCCSLVLVVCCCVLQSIEFWLQYCTVIGTKLIVKGWISRASWS